jgi:type IV pilus assembly protein PilC
LPTYQYKAKNQAGQEITAELEASDSKDALAKVMDLGLFPLILKEKNSRREPKPEIEALARAGEPTTFAPMPLTGQFFGASLKRMIQFTRQFAALQDAGLPIVKNLQILLRQLPPGRFRRVVADMLHDVEQGKSLTEAMAKHPRDFDLVYIKMVEAGETGGFLERIMNRLADAKEKTLELRRKVIRASLYPALVCFVALMIVLFITFVIVPMLAEGGVNTGPLAPLINASQWFVHQGLLGMIILIVGLIFLFKAIRSNWIGRYILDAIKLNIPVFGRFFYKTAMVRFSRVLGSLVEAGVPILQALASVRDTTGNEVFAQAADKIRGELIEGTSLTKAVMSRWVFDPIATNMIEVGEETGDLDKVLLKIADNYQNDLDTHIGYMMTFLEVGLIVLMCVLVGGLVLMMWGAIGSMAGGL